jgi:hypothetical protein
VGSRIYSRGLSVTGESSQQRPVPKNIPIPWISALLYLTMRAFRPATSTATVPDWATPERFNVRF